MVVMGDGDNVGPIVSRLGKFGRKKMGVFVVGVGDATGSVDSVGHNVPPIVSRLGTRVGIKMLGALAYVGRPMVGSVAWEFGLGGGATMEGMSAILEGGRAAEILGVSVDGLGL
jgi:hypothetical protein